MTGTSFSPSLVKVSFAEAAKALKKRRGSMRSYGTVVSSRSDSIMVFPGANTSALCTKASSGYSRISAMAGYFSDA